MPRYPTGNGRTPPSSWRGHSSRPKHSFSRQPRPIPPALGDEMTTRTLDQLNTRKTSITTEISDCRFVASYNLTEGLRKTILVPGGPPMWTPLPAATRLAPDSGSYFRDDNAARFPEYPLEPAVESIFKMDNSFDPSEIDVFGCGSTLGNLLRFAMGEPQPFSFTVHTIGKTVFLVRRNLSPREKIEDIVGYGHAFAEAYTTWGQDVKGSASHQRIIRYWFGGLQCLVRFEADGHVLDQFDDSDDESLAFTSAGAEATASTQASADALADIFSKNAIQTKQSLAAIPGESIKIRSQGSLVPQSSIFDLKTRTSRKPREEIMKEQLPRLWVRQINKFILAFHTQGHFDSPEVLDVTAEINEWERKSEAALHRMAALLRDIREMAINTPERRLEVRGDDSSTLRFHRLSMKETGQWEVLPDELRKQWAQE